MTAKVAWIGTKSAGSETILRALFQEVPQSHHDPVAAISKNNPSCTSDRVPATQRTYVLKSLHKKDDSKSSWSLESRVLAPTCSSSSSASAGGWSKGTDRLVMVESLMMDDTTSGPGWRPIVHAAAVPKDNDENENESLVSVHQPGPRIELVTFEFANDDDVDDNETQNKTMKQVLSETWTDFDCVVVVLDGSVMEEEENDGSSKTRGHQENFLDWIKTMLQAEDSVPVLLLLANKTDQYFDDDFGEENAIDKVVERISKRLHVSNRKEALLQLWNLMDKKETPANSLLQPVLIPVSGLYAEMFQLASRLKKVQQGQQGEKRAATISLSQWEEDLVNRIGRQQLGELAWRKLQSRDEKCKALLERVFNDAESVESFLFRSNLDKVSAMISYCCMQDRMVLQRAWIEQQLEKAITHKLNWKKAIPLADQVRTIVFKKARLYHKDEPGRHQAVKDSDIEHAFWVQYDKCEDEAFEQFQSPGSVAKLWVPMKQLLQIGNMLREDTVLFQGDSWDEAKVKVNHRLTLLIRRQVDIMVRKHKVWFQSFDHDQWKTRKEHQGETETIPNWNVLTPPEWTGMLRHLLIPMQQLMDLFVDEIIILNQLVEQTERAWKKNSLTASECPECRNTLLTMERYCVVCSKHWNKPSYCPDADECFGCQHYGFQPPHKMDLNRCRKFKISFWHPHPGSREDSISTAYNIHTGEWTPLYPTSYEKWICADLLPRTLSDPKSLGHGVYLLVTFHNNHNHSKNNHNKTAGAAVTIV